jgi:hypothetical protein
LMGCLNWVSPISNRRRDVAFLALFGHAPLARQCPAQWGLCCKTRPVRLQSLVVSFNRPPCLRSPLSRLRCRFVDAYAGQVTARGGETRQRMPASRLRFCAVAVSGTSSLTPLEPRSRNRSSLRMRFICAKSHLDLLALAARLLEGSCIGQRTDTIAIGFLQIELARSIR